MKRPLFLYCQRFLPVLFLATSPLLAQQSISDETDFIYRETREYTISDNTDTTYEARGNIQREWKYVSERARQTNHIHLTESYFRSISDVRGTFNGSSISRDDITSESEYNEDVFLTGRTIYTIALNKNISRNDVFSCSYREYYPDITFFPVLMVPAIDSVAEFRLVIKHPRDIRLRWEIFYPRDTIPYSLDTSDEKKLIITFHHCKSVRPLPAFPFNDMQASILFSFDKVQENENVLQPINIIEWYRCRNGMSPSIDSLHASAIGKNLDTTGSEEAKLRSINSFVKNSIRYIADERGENAYLYRNLNEVAGQSYGDCKDHAALACALARGYGYDVTMALVATEPIPPFHSVNPSLFNHIICLYRKDGKSIFFDPTQKYVDFGKLQDQLYETNSFVLDDANPRYEQIPFPDRSPSLELSIRARLDSLNRCPLHVVLRHTFASRTRRILGELSKDKMQLYLQTLLNSQLQQLHLEKFVLVHESDTAIIFTGTADMSKFFIPVNSKYYFPKTAFLGINGEILEREKDAYPLYVTNPVEKRLTISLDSSKYKTKGDQLVIGTPNGRAFAQSKLSSSGSSLIAEYIYRTKFKWHSYQDKDRMLMFVKEYLRNKKTMFTVTME